MKEIPGGPVVRNPPANTEVAGSVPDGEEPTRHGATEALHHTCWARELEPGPRSQRVSPTRHLNRRGPACSQGEPGQARIIKKT